MPLVVMIFSFPVIDANQAESTSNTSAIIGRVMGVAVVLIIAIYFTDSHSGSDSSAEKSQWKSLCKNKALSYTLILV